jgi:hypothetical protein
VDDRLRIDLELLSVCAESRCGEIFHLDETAVRAERRAVVGRVINEHDVADARQRLGL